MGRKRLDCDSNWALLAAWNVAPLGSSEEHVPEGIYGQACLDTFFISAVHLPWIIHILGPDVLADTLE
jgi:hypothetical protein